MHIALKKNMYDAFQTLLRWLGKKWYEIALLWDKKLLGWQDDEGNTVLHIAISKGQIEASSRFQPKENKFGTQWTSTLLCKEVTIRIDYNKLNNFLLELLLI
jgi:hypothetical protein